eukprot:861193-Prymnesium_polylepis.1
MSYKGVKVLDIFIHTLSYWQLHPAARSNSRVALKYKFHDADGCAIEGERHAICCTTLAVLTL